MKDGGPCRKKTRLSRALSAPRCEVGFALARELKADRKKAPKHLPRMIMLINEAKHEFYLTAVPRPARVAFAALLGVLAYAVGRLGYGARPVR